MGVSAEGCWFRGKPDRYFKWVGTETIHEFFISGPEKLSSIIHEINECEVHDILTRWGYENAIIEPTKRTIFDFDDGDILNVSHIVSPYGVWGCVIPRRDCYLRW